VQQRKRRHPAHHQPGDHDPDRDADLLQVTHRREDRLPPRKSDVRTVKFP
jgi:hypothetical protein